MQSSGILSWARFRYRQSSMADIRVRQGLQLRFYFNSTTVPLTFDSSSTWLQFDGHSTAYQMSWRSQWHNPLATVMLIYLFI